MDGRTPTTTVSDPAGEEEHEEEEEEEDRQQQQELTESFMNEPTVTSILHDKHTEPNTGTQQGTDQIRLQNKKRTRPSEKLNNETRRRKIANWLAG